MSEAAFAFRKHKKIYIGRLPASLKKVGEEDNLWLLILTFGTAFTVAAAPAKKEEKGEKSEAVTPPGDGDIIKYQ